MELITASIEKVAYPLGPSWTRFPFGLTLGMWSRGEADPDCVGNGEHIIRVTKGDDGAYTVTRYTLSRVEVASVRVSSGAATVDTIAGIILLLAN